MSTRPLATREVIDWRTTGSGYSESAATTWAVEAGFARQDNISASRSVEEGGVIESIKRSLGARLVQYPQ